MTVLTGDPHAWRLPQGGGAAVAVGVFDGVHRGHQAVLAELATVADGGPVVALTFDPHPRAVVAPERAPLLLGTVEQRVEWLRAEGVSVVGVLPFDRIREWSADAFVEVVLRRALDARVVCVGVDFRFGYDRSGDATTLRSGGFDVRTLDLLGEGDGPISSTAIRRRLELGDTAGAADLIGRPHTVRGPVVRGDGRGSTVGVPTANVAPDPRVQLPANGVYTAGVQVGDRSHPAVVNVGTRPTFEGTAVAVEAHLLDGEHDLYGRSVDVAFGDRLRDERRFDGVDALVAQIRVDIADARRLLGA
jgi:riboflavin kinase / FMN adenylyltransferase